MNQVRRTTTGVSPAAIARATRSGLRRPHRAGAALLTALALSACVSVKAPDEPIVVELNINIKQEVVYRLAEDAGSTIQQNPEIF